ncbi:MAG: heme exporter protein CcmD [Beijerinckiaceae bacterium]|nr:heme exporter protein CcmD [Beijerinckiaceae bacterium]
MSHDPHFGSVIAAYGLAFVMVAGMAGAILADYMRLKHALSLLAAREKYQGDSGQHGKEPDQELLDLESLD